jgi:hypothetical protein
MQTVGKITVRINKDKMLKIAPWNTEGYKSRYFLYKTCQAAENSIANLDLHVPRLSTGRKTFYLRNICSSLGPRFRSKWRWGIFGQWGIFTHFTVNTQVGTEFLKRLFIRYSAWLRAAMPCLQAVSRWPLPAEINIRSQAVQSNWDLRCTQWHLYGFLSACQCHATLIN